MIKYLSDIVGVSGAEDDIRDYIVSVITPHCDSIEIDSMGNIIAKKSYNPDYKTIALATHMDEAGFIITDITDDGYLKFDAIGDIDPLNIISSKVRIGDAIGIISLKAIHLSTKEEREKKIKISDLYIDIGARNKNEAIELVQKGDYCSFISKSTDFGDKMLKGKALAGRAGCYLLIKLLCCDIKPKYNLVFIFTTQNKISSRGAIVAANSLKNIKKIIVFDEAEADAENNIKVNNGIVIEKSPNDSEKSRELTEDILSVAKKNKVDTQTLVRARITDRERFKEYLVDTDTALISFPCKYNHTSVCVIGKNDIETAEKLILTLLEEEE